MATPFRPYPEEEPTGSFVLQKFLIDTILQAPFHFLAIVPHVLIPIYGIYRLMKGSGWWTPQVDFAVDIILVPLLQGLSAGGILYTLALRYLTPTGRKIAHKRQDKAATDDEDTHQLRLDITFWTFAYLGFATILWQQLPATDGPGVAALQRLAGQVGVDFGKLFNTKK